MYRVVLIDDEIMALRGMAGSLPWNEMNMEIAGTARDGASGLELIRRRKPDIVITDIRMPGMDGLDMIRETLALWPETIFIILSGYSEFQYAKKAIAYGVMGYLEKPIDVGELKSTLKKACDILEQRKQQENTSKIQSKNERLELLKKMLRGEAIGEKDIERFGISSELLQSYTVAVCRPAGDMVLTERSLFWAEEALRELGKGPGACYALRDNGRLVLLLRKYDVKKDEEKFIESFRRIMSAKGCCPLKIGVCRSGHTTQGLSMACANAGYALRFCIFYGCGPVLYFDRGMRDKSADMWAWKEQIGTYTSHMDKDTVLGLVREALEAMYTGRVGLESFVHECMEMLYCCVDAMDALQRTKVKKYILEKENPLSVISGFARYEEARTYLIEMFLKIMSVGDAGDNREYHYKIAKAQEYILKHYMESITLQQLAELVDMSPAYFSVLFKKTAGVSYLQYLTDIRMEQAKRRLLAGEKIVEISREVGYFNYRHFSEAFKRHVGVTPKEFRNSQGK